jgi:hypothetical protein
VWRRRVIAMAAVATHTARWSAIDWEELSGLDRVVAAFEVGDNTIVVETTDGREVRITAWRDLSTDRYVADFERRTHVNVGGQELLVWAHTPAYERCTSDDLSSCLEAAVGEVDRVHVY